MPRLVRGEGSVSDRRLAPLSERGWRLDVGGWTDGEEARCVVDAVDEFSPVVAFEDNSAVSLLTDARRGILGERRHLLRIEWFAGAA